MHDFPFPTREQQKDFAKKLRKALAELGVRAQHQTVLEALSRAGGFRDDNGAAARLRSAAPGDTMASDTRPGARILLRQKGCTILSAWTDSPALAGLEVLLALDGTNPRDLPEPGRVALVEDETSQAQSWAVTRLSITAVPSTVIGRFEVARIRGEQKLAMEQGIAALVARLEEAKADETILDDIVTETHVDGVIDEVNSTDDEDEQEAIIEDAEVEASAINNDGWQNQIEYLAGAIGFDETKKIVERLLGVTPPRPAAPSPAAATPPEGMQGLIQVSFEGADINEDFSCQDAFLSLLSATRPENFGLHFSRLHGTRDGWQAVLRVAASSEEAAQDLLTLYRERCLPGTEHGVTLWNFRPLQAGQSLFEVNVRAKAQLSTRNPRATSEIGAPWESYSWTSIEHEGQREIAELRCDTLSVVVASSAGEAVKAARDNAPRLTVEGWTVEAIEVWVDPSIDVTRIAD